MDHRQLDEIAMTDEDRCARRKDTI